MLRLFASSVRPLSIRCATQQGRRSGTAKSVGGEAVDALGGGGLQLAGDRGGVVMDEPEES